MDPDPWRTAPGARPGTQLGAADFAGLGAAAMPYGWPKPPAMPGYPGMGMPSLSPDEAAKTQALLSHPSIALALQQAGMAGPNGMANAMALMQAGALTHQIMMQQQMDDKRRGGGGGGGGGGRRRDEKRRNAPREELPPANSPELQQIRAGQQLPLNAVTVDVCLDPQGMRMVTKGIDDATQQGDHNGKAVLANTLAGDIVRLSLHQNGCRVIQKIFEEVSTDQQLALASPLKNHVLRLIESQNGNHVIQKVLERLPPERSQFIIDEISPSLEQMAVHGYGCRIVQRILEHCMPHQTAPILDRIVANLLSFCREQYGNYVVQHVLEHGRPQDRQKVFELVRGNPMELACHKFGSNVVEKSLLLADPPERAAIVNAILGEPRDPRRLQTMVADRFANYVVQRILDVGDHAQKEEVFWVLKDYVPHLKKTSYGKHIRAKLERLGQEFQPGLPI